MNILIRISMKRLIDLIRKLGKTILWVILGILIVLNLLIVLSGKFYLYKGIRYTYLIGKTGPGIYDKPIFPSKKIRHCREIYSFRHSKKYNNYVFNNEDNKMLQDLDTRALLVLKGDSLLYEKYYKEHTPQTVSNSFSAAKTVVALLVGIAVEEGKIKNLDEPVGNYLPEFNKDSKRNITIRHLLTMSSGLDWEESSSNPLSENAESYYGWDLWGLTMSQKAVESPGRKFKYQSGNSQLLGYVIEKATGKSVSEYTQEKIWKRIGTEHDAFWSMDRENGYEKSFCCLYATARDFLRLGVLIHRGGKWGEDQVVPSWFIKEMSVPAKLSTEEGVPNYRYGLHVWTYPEKMGTITYFRGIKGQYIVSMPKDDIVFVRLGMQRKDNVEIPESRRNDPSYVKKIEKRVGHPEDFFSYLRIARDIASQNGLIK